MKNKHIKAHSPKVTKNYIGYSYVKPRYCDKGPLFDRGTVKYDRLKF